MTAGAGEGAGAESGVVDLMGALEQSVKDARSARERHFAPEVCGHCGLTVQHAYMAMHVAEFHHHCEHCGEADG